MLWNKATTRILLRLTPLNTLCNKSGDLPRCWMVPITASRQLHASAIFSAGPTRARRLKPEELRPIKNKVDEDGNPLPCALCKIKIDYKNVRLLSQFISNDTGMIYGRRITGLCGHKQKELTKAIRRARTMVSVIVVR
ncbi:28S ribosomal protein S18c, mitochondrial [Trichoplax sp. H2]|nr:28S ribosomal protein S18c, mitochondrial [Trichoplax sp. H2]|eukprot:RDD41969.1 28S ribosomal protein S18c, mitochondrial [Trichoplax sp. H2]